MKLMGMGLIVISAAMTGAFLASGLSGRVTAIEAAVSLLGYLRDRLRYLSPTVFDLVDGACGQPSLAKNRFLPLCREGLRRGEAFPAAWRRSLAAAPGLLGREEAALLADLGGVLGSSDLESQLASLDAALARLASLLSEAASHREKRQKLYGTLGVLSGLAVVILLI